MYLSNDFYYLFNLYGGIRMRKKLVKISKTCFLVGLLLISGIIISSVSVLGNNNFNNLIDTTNNLKDKNNL